MGAILCLWKCLFGFRVSIRIFWRLGLSVHLLFSVAGFKELSCCPAE
ncbi:hypothetical protein Dm11a5_1461 [Dehalococcoides mccartyi]|uniref:Uncharacterized protein n=1 Tax=Dehalococcoides mccartyi TaxID=61435 RepID=A0A142VD95_9CHLR|nr:hypothetical protein Dm11a5_1461 [Dehalococcoides mccartyi]